ncbi:MAG: endonuclease/exonuclease/phosphatase family protein [Flavobacteriales bacterium]|nr:endonuclease/exonuclease/phosphatase family protein [Flavobacteriales bacterium]
MKKLKFIGRLIFGLNVLLAISTLLGYSAAYVNPSSFWLFAFFGLALPYLLLLNLAFTFYWLFRANSRFVLSLLILALGYQSIPSFVQLRFGDHEKTARDFKVMSFNVRVFDLYMWTKEKTTRNQIFEFLKEEDPDVLCLQEFYHTDKQHPRYEFKTLDTLVKFLSAKNYHVHYTTTTKENNHWGLVTFSKFPIENKGIVPFTVKDDNACTFTDLKIDSRTVRIYNTHLASIKLKKRDYKTMKTINEKDYSNLFSKGWGLLEKIKFGFERRSDQANKIHTSIEESLLPTIVCGDFNDTPSSYSYRTIRNELNDAYIESGSGLGRTYIGEFPSFRIDYILYSKEFIAKDYTTHAVKLSDHHPVSTILSPNN